jgi:hypothetical protein
MDVKDIVQNSWLTAQDVKNSPTKIATILDAGKVEEAVDQKGLKYKALVLTVELDKNSKTWKLNRYSARKLAEKFGTETSFWVGKQVALTTMLMQGGKEGVIPV